MTVALLGGAAFAIFLGVMLLRGGATAGLALIASSLGPLYVLWHARRQARANRNGTLQS